MTDSSGAAMGEFEAIALEKMTRVLGAATARRTYDAVLRDAGLAELRTADDLYLFASHLTQRGGFEGAVGGLLSVAAVVRGAARHPQ